jgi:NAD(P)-dependent dehydrogenase (short-subunit alcohol dehydrogenase family)
MRAVIVGIRTLGRVLALRFARDGWDVVCAARTQSDVDALATDVTAAGGRGIAVRADLADPATLTALAAEPVDLCIAAQSAGGRFGSLPLLELPDDELDRSYQAYVRGTFHLLRTVGRSMVERGKGTFIQIGTSSGLRTKDGFAALGATQHGLKALVQVAAREWRTRGVHVAYLAIDGAIDSPKTQTWLASAGPDRGIPQDEIANACAYLHAQDRRAWTHEMVLRPTGGDWTAPT